MSQQFHNTINQHTAALGWTTDTEGEDLISLLFDMGEGRSQRVVIAHHDLGNGTQIVEVSSAVLKMDGLPNHQLGREMAITLLKENAQKPFSNWAIDGEGETAHLVATSRWLLSDLDKEELHHAVVIVAGMADRLEEQLGVDHF
ncbi:Uncharacterised protein [BD1-7 clade bacterium]|uniref:Uncharacterized protein n=1 Tax=BD1-7 clade bacterium TaxID=2029982 RepID=A0A5S9NAD3_9GAMM|nr:Uncharacterised protein [BD1-7 clade bacterium]